MIADRYLHTLGAGFEGRYTNKAGETAEGSAVFYRRSRFRLVRQKDIPMKDIFAALLADVSADADQSRHAQFLPLLRASPHLVQALQRVRCSSRVLKGCCEIEFLRSLHVM